MGQAKALGADLRSLRKSRGLTLEALSGQLGKSVGWLSQVERDISTLGPEDIPTVAKALDVPVSLFAVQSSARNEEGRVVRKATRRPLRQRVPGLDEELLSPDLTDSFELVHSTFHPKSKSNGEVTRETAELGFVVSGKIDVWLGGERFVVDEGDSFRVRDETLRWANPYDEPAILVWVISPPIY